MYTAFSHIRVSARMLSKRAVFSTIAVVALALGIGLTTTMFSIVYGLVVRGLPYDQAEDLIAIGRTRPSQSLDFLPVSIHDFEDWREQQTSSE